MRQVQRTRYTVATAPAAPLARRQAHNPAARRDVSITCHGCGMGGMTIQEIRRHTCAGTVYDARPVAPRRHHWLWGVLGLLTIGVAVAVPWSQPTTTVQPVPLPTALVEPFVPGVVDPLTLPELPRVDYQPQPQPAPQRDPLPTPAPQWEPNPNYVPPSTQQETAQQPAQPPEARTQPEAPANVAPPTTAPTSAPREVERLIAGALPSAVPTEAAGVIVEQGNSTHHNPGNGMQPQCLLCHPTK